MKNGWQLLQLQSAYVRTFNNDNRPLFILSDKAVFFHSILQAKAILRLPSASEIITPADALILENYLRGKYDMPIRILVDLDMVMINQPVFDGVRARLAELPIVSKSPDGGLLYYSVKP